MTTTSVIRSYMRRPQHAAHRHQPANRYPVEKSGRAQHRLHVPRRRLTVVHVLGSATISGVVLLTAWPHLGAVLTLAGA